MRKLHLLLLFISILFIACQPKVDPNKNPNKELSQSEHLVMSADWFQKSAEMRASFYQAYNLASYKLKEHVNNYKGEKPTAVVLDIDETVLDNSPFEKHLIDKGELYNSAGWKEWTDKGAAKKLPGALEFTNYAKELGVEVIYISNRKVNELEKTIENLKAAGFPNAAKEFVILREMDKSGNKTERRNNVNEKYETLLYVGDNLTDYSQIFSDRGEDLGFKIVDEYKSDFGEKFILLPNPMYGEWEGAIYGNDYSLAPEKKRALRKQILEGY
ncbi:MAG: 5'-nucleotidase, lipoprotein e(P4) family [Salinivirgaceae bacterium]|nr:5'-nucleotidase, lipoprotein e(P4) family [Salinivirgaceae bacterium]